uniref:Putative CLAVATA3/ESR (CLE)-related protein 27 n=1 Tax=Davidia involucrata TaxID=16924 RepID=A0A5B7BC09_DAVIN
MSFAGGRRIMYSSLVVVLLIISVLHIWVFSDCRVGAIRIYPPSSVAEEEESQTMKATKSEGDLFHKYFNGRVSDLNSTQNGFQDNKRRVPSCPDPLHNK